jgi:hypothetical protein
MKKKLIPRLARIPSYSDSQNMGSFACTSNFNGAIKKEGTVKYSANTICLFAFTSVIVVV